MKIAVPQEGTIEIGNIVKLMQEFSCNPLDQSSISGSKITDLPLFKLLKSIVKGRNDEKNPFKTYILEHDGHFILLDLKQFENGVGYAIYDSLAYAKNGEVRENKVKNILQKVFPGKKLIYDKDQYIKIKQGEDEDPFNIPDTDNCGLSAIFAQFIYEQFEDFPKEVFVRNKKLYYALNEIAQGLRGEQGANIDKAVEELTNLALHIVENKKLELKNINLPKTSLPKLLEIKANQKFNMRQEMANVAQIYQKYDDNQEFEMLYDLAPEFKELLERVYVNQNQLDKENSNLIVGIYETIVGIFHGHKEGFNVDLQDLFNKKAKGENYDNEKLAKDIKLTQDLINTFNIFYELKKSFYNKLSDENKNLLESSGSYDSIINMSDIAMNIISMEAMAVGDNIDIRIIKDFDKAIELCLGLVKENEEIYKESDNEVIRLLSDHLNNCLFRYRMTDSFQGQGEGAFIPQEKLSQIFASYAANASEKNDHNIMGFLSDYSMNNNEESLKKFGSILVKVENDERKLGFLRVAIEQLLRGVSLAREYDLKINKFKVIYNLLTNENLVKFIEGDVNLEFALIASRQALYTKNQKEEYNVYDEEVSRIIPESLSGIYSEMYLLAIFTTQDLEKSKMATLNHLEKGFASHRPNQQAVDLYNLGATFNFRDFFAYNEDHPKYLLKNESMTASVEIHKKAIEKAGNPEIKISLLRSLFKLQYLLAENKGSKETAEKIIEIAADNQDIQNFPDLSLYKEYLDREMDNKNLDIEGRLEIFKKIDPHISDYENDIISKNNGNLISQQYLGLFQGPDSKQGASQDPKVQKEYVLKIDGNEVDIKDLKFVKHENTEYKIYCPESVLEKSGDNRAFFEEALKNPNFASAKGQAGVKYISDNEEGKVYEIKITKNQARILGIETEYKDEDGNEVKIIYFSKHLSKTKDSGKRSNAAYNNTKDKLLKKPVISHEEKQEKPSGSPSETDNGRSLKQEQSFLSSP